jgi:hypothetical protein
MSIEYKIDKVKGITYVVWKGEVNASEFLRHVNKLCNDPDWSSSKRMHVADVRHVKVHRSIDKFILQAASIYYGWRVYKIVTLKAAIVTDTEKIRANYFSRLMNDYDSKVKVFGDMASATKWLGIDNEETEKILMELLLTTSNRNCK